MWACHWARALIIETVEDLGTSFQANTLPQMNETEIQASEIEAIVGAVKEANPKMNTVDMDMDNCRCLC
jgi:hypothetical protein